jgi:N-acylneuraminate cytidylyltransferase
LINGKKVLAVIPARGGSKGIPRKNIIELAGKPLLAWSIIEAAKSAYIDRIVVSSEDQEIIRVAREWGAEAPFVRPVELALDDTPGIDPVLHAIESLPGYDYVVLLQPTSPLRSVEDIDSAIALCLETESDFCVSVCRAQENPWWMVTIGEKGRLAPLMQDDERYPRRQDLPAVYSYNGAVYVGNCLALVRERSFFSDPTGYLMPPERSVDIDTASDLDLAAALLRNLGH